MEKLQYFDSELNQNYIPYVVETSIGFGSDVPENTEWISGKEKNSLKTESVQY